MQTLRIISRNSPLALRQAELVKCRLNTLYPDLRMSIFGVTTLGDKILDKSLDKIGGKGLFIKELELALLEGRAEIAVHSLKDLPANLLPEFSLAAILEREDASDAFVSNSYPSLDSMPETMVIGTSSLRRVAFLKRYYPKLTTKLLRGNFQTRLKKLDEGEYDGIIVATAGLNRLNLAGRIRESLSVELFIPAIGQGALAVEILANNLELNNLLAPLTDPNTFIEVVAEREVGRYLKASCSVPIAVHARIRGNQFRLKAMVADSEEDIFCFAEVVTVRNNYMEAALDCAKQLLNQGALKVLKKFS